MSEQGNAEENKRHKNKGMIFFKQHEYLATWIALIISIVTLFSVEQIIHVNNEVVQSVATVSEEITNSQQNTNFVQDAFVSNSGKMVMGDDKSITSNNMGIALSALEKGDIESAMQYAECYFSVGKYITAFRIYDSLFLDNPDNPELMTDLAYLYANGLGCEQDVEYAIELYDEAISKGFERAYSNELALFMREREGYVEKVELLQTALRLGDVYVESYVRANYSDEMDVSEDEYVEYLKTASAEDVNDIISDYFYVEDLVGEEKLPSFPSTDYFNRYELKGRQNWFSEEENGSGTAYIFNHYIKKCKNIDVLLEGIIYQFEK